MKDPVVVAKFLAPVIKGKGLVGLLAWKVDSDDPKIEKQKRAEPN